MRLRYKSAKKNDRFHGEFSLYYSDYTLLNYLYLTHDCVGFRHVLMTHYAQSSL